MRSVQHGLVSPTGPDSPHHSHLLASCRSVEETCIDTLGAPPLKEDVGGVYCDSHLQVTDMVARKVLYHPGATPGAFGDIREGSPRDAIRACVEPGACVLTFDTFQHRSHPLALAVGAATAPPVGQTDRTVSGTAPAAASVLAILKVVHTLVPSRRLFNPPNGLIRCVPGKQDGQPGGGCRCCRYAVRTGARTGSHVRGELSRHARVPVRT